MNFLKYHLHFTVIKTRDDKETVNDDEYENDFIILMSLITPNHYIGRKNDKIMLKWRKLKTQTNHLEKCLVNKW